MRYKRIRSNSNLYINETECYSNKVHYAKTKITSNKYLQEMQCHLLLVKNYPGIPKTMTAEESHYDEQLTSNQNSRCPSEELPLAIENSKPASSNYAEECLMAESYPWTFYLIYSLITSCLASFNFGYNIVTLAIVQIFTETQLSFRSGLYITPQQMGFVIGSFSLGALAASLLTGHFADVFGRKYTLFLNAFVYCVGVLVFSLSRSFYHMLIGRIVIGVGAGISCVVVPIYLAEISSVSVRGFIGIFHQCSLVVGILISQIISNWLGNEENWRLYFACSLIPAVLMIFLLPFCPESPVYYMLRGNKTGCKHSLRRLRPKLWKVPEEVDEISEAIRISKQNGERLTIFELFSLQTARRSLLFCTAMHFTQQFSGIDLVLLFLGDWFKNYGVISILVGCIIIFGTLLSIWLVEKSGRRSLTLISAAGSFIGLTLLSFFSTLSINSFWTFLALAVYLVSFSVGLGPITWIIINDIFPPNARASAISVAVAVNWLSKFAVMLMYEPLKKNFGSFSLLPFSFILLLFFIYAAYALKETKGRHAIYL